MLPSPPKGTLYSSAFCFLPITLLSGVSNHLLPVSIDFPILAFHMNGIISYVAFCDWLLSCFQGSSMLQHVLEIHSFLWLNNVLLYGCATFCLSVPKKQTYRLFQPLEHYVCVSCSVMSNSLRPHGLYPARLLCPRHSPGKNTGVGCHALQGIFPTQRWNHGLPLCRQIPYCLNL